MKNSCSLFFYRLNYFLFRKNINEFSILSIYIINECSIHKYKILNCEKEANPLLTYLTTHKHEGQSFRLNLGWERSAAGIFEAT